MGSRNAEKIACTPVPIVASGFNPDVNLPYGLTTDHIGSAMTDFLRFLGFINSRLYSEKISRLESIMMPANFSSLVGEFMNARIPEHCRSVVKNKYHNGHPDLIPARMFSGDSVQHAPEGIEIKASRYGHGWQGHNPEDTWLMVFTYDSNRPKDGPEDAKPVEFLMVLGARLVKADWLFSGRSGASRRTITASVTPSGFKKMAANWIYKSPNLRLSPTRLAQMEAQLEGAEQQDEESPSD